MPYVASIGTYLPCWGTPNHRVAGDDEDAITLAVEAGRAALAGSAAVERVVLVSRDLPLLESSNAAVLLAGLGLDPELEVDERLGGAPATLDALSSARPRTLVIGVDLDPAGAAAVLTADDGLAGAHRRPRRAQPAGADAQRRWRRSRLRRPAAAARARAGRLAGGGVAGHPGRGGRRRPRNRRRAVSR